MGTEGRRIDAVALDAMGVIYPVADDLRNLLIPFLRSRGCVTPDEEIVEAFRSCYRRGAPAQTIWEVAGIDWTDGALELDFLACYQLNDGVVEFLEAMRAHSIPVYGLSNDVREWTYKRLQLLGIDGYFSGWAISGEVGSPKPERAIYERLLAMLPCLPSLCLFVDDRTENLEAAAALGLQSARFGDDEPSNHPCVADFGALIRLITV